MAEMSRKFDIYNNKPRKVICISNSDKWKTHDDYKLQVGKVYTIVSLNVCGFHTEVKVKELDGVFNSCSFEEV